MFVLALKEEVGLGVDVELGVSEAIEACSEGTAGTWTVSGCLGLG